MSPRIAAITNLKKPQMCKTISCDIKLSINKTLFYCKTIKKGLIKLFKQIIILVGATGFEPVTSSL